MTDETYYVSRIEELETQLAASKAGHQESIKENKKQQIKLNNYYQEVERLKAAKEHKGKVAAEYQDRYHKEFGERAAAEKSRDELRDAWEQLCVKLGCEADKSLEGVLAMCNHLRVGYDELKAERDNAQKEAELSEKAREKYQRYWREEQNRRLAAENQLSIVSAASEQLKKQAKESKQADAKIEDNLDDMDDVNDILAIMDEPFPETFEEAKDQLHRFKPRFMSFLNRPKP